MKILFDARYIHTDFHDGISRYTTELGNALARQTAVTFIISDKAQLKFLPSGADFVMLHPVTSWKEPLSSLWLNKFHPDWVVSPLQTIGSAGRKFKMVLNQQDMTYYRHSSPPPQFSKAVRAAWRLYHATYIPGRITLAGADLVATVSETSKKEIIEANLTKKPIVVVPNAPPDLSEFLASPPYVINKPKNLVYMGAFIPYKNAETLIQAMEWLPDKTLHLLSRIKPERKAELKRMIPEGAKVVFHGGVSDEEYARLLADNAIMVSASKSEGFGLPLVEAQQLGVACVVSDLEVFHEVGGNAALYADPSDPQNFAAKIASLDDKTLRDELIKKGKKQASKYSWDNSAKALLEAMRRVDSKD
jgi:glycosyltransferase involved in cell wall biosynthesis